MIRTFISYAHADAAFATRLASALPTLGIEPWIDRDGIHGGTRWSSAIQQALDSAEALILILSPASMTSSNVEDEWQYALDKGKPVFPVLLEPTDVHFQLGRIQYTDFYGQPFDAALTKLATAFRRMLDTEDESATDTAIVDEASVRAAHAAQAIGPPTGTVTFLFTEIDGASELWESHGKAMASAHERHQGLMRQTVAGQEGFVFRSIGDAFFAAFVSAGAGLAAAIDAQRVISTEDWSAFGDDFPGIQVRMAVHTGEVTERAGAYVGPAVNRATRLVAEARGGQVLLSSATYNIVREDLQTGFEVRDFGQSNGDPRHGTDVYQLLGPGLPEARPAPATVAPQHPRERVRVGEPDPGDDPGAANDDADDRALDASTPADPWSRLEAAVRSDVGASATLTPTEALELARHRPADLREYRLGRIAEWSQQRFRLDGRFVGLTLLVDQGEEAVQGRWAAQEEQFQDLGAVLADTTEQAIVVLGPPGGGKSTLLRRLELDTAIAGLREEGPDGSRVTFFISLNTYDAGRPEDPLPAPGDWLAERWAARYSELPPLDAFVGAGRITLLLDALNEMPAADEADFHERVRLWKRWLIDVVGRHQGNRVVISCRSLDYSQSLSTPALRVPQVRIEPLVDAQIEEFLAQYSPEHHREIWAALQGSPQIEVLRSPYFLALLVEQVDATGDMPAGRAALFTGFVRQALLREIEHGNALFQPGPLLESRDLKRIAKWRWKSAYDLPERGPLLAKLAALAHAMQSDRADGERSQVRIDVDDALDLLDSEADEAILAAGEALAVLDEDESTGDLMFIHQLVQEYFAARLLAREPNPDLVRVPWRAADIRPTVAEVVERLDPADPLPPLAGTGWEETTILATAMADDAVPFLRPVMETNLVLAGRAAAQPEMQPRLPGDLLDALRDALVERSCDPAADLRHRIACGYVLGDLDDPRFERRDGPQGPYLLPPLVAIPGGVYPIGADEPIVSPEGTWTDHMPRHEVTLAGYEIGRFPVTNAEWACFQEAGGYEDEQWWDTEDARAWRRGENTAAGIHAGVKDFVARCRANPELMDELLAAGSWDETMFERAQRRLAMSEAELDAHLVELYPGGRFTEPLVWRDSRFNHPTQPVVGVCWYEARAYLNWLSAQSGLAFQLPSEAEWEAAARGLPARRYAYGDDFDPWKGNTAETHIRRNSPVGVFPDGDTPEGIADLTGNTLEWTSSAFGSSRDASAFPYPYDAEDGRENPDLPATTLRVLRGGSWSDVQSVALAAYRVIPPPGNRAGDNGFRALLRREASPNADATEKPTAGNTAE